MILSPFVNIHCHKTVVSQVVSIENVFVQERRTMFPNGFYSLGLHPWHISGISTDLDVEKTLREYIEADTSLIAVGEIGIDHAIAVPIDVQISIFEKQLLIAQQYGLPVIIHCVRAFSEVIHSKKKFNTTVPMIIHGFCANEHIAKELLKHGFYFSFGKQLLLQNEQALASLRYLPLESVFFETDEGNFTIEDVYGIASNLFNIEMTALKEVIYANFKNCFNRSTLLKKS